LEPQSTEKKTDDANPPPIPPQADIVLKLEIKPEGYFLTIEKQVVSIPLVGNEFDEVGLVAQLRKTKELYPSKIDAAVAMSDELPYERLIKGMDACLKAGFSNISVLTGGP
jgi:biopolymer transport protein ExbD